MILKISIDNYEKFEFTTVLKRNSRLMDKRCNSIREKDKKLTMIDKTLHRN